MIELGANDWVVLCTDGLPTVLREEEITAILTAASDPGQACEALIERTKDGGAPDNVTVIAIQYCQKDDGADDISGAIVPNRPKRIEDSTESTG